MQHSGKKTKDRKVQTYYNQLTDLSITVFLILICVILC